MIWRFMKDILKAIDKAHPKMISLLKKWANVNSGSENIKGLAKMLVLIKKEALLLNGEMEEIALKPRIKVDSKGKLVEIPHGNALLIKKNPSANVQFLFGGHYDTVFQADSPFKKCKLLDFNTLNGPGVADMKGGLIVMLTALKILDSSSYADKFGYEVIINPDEEIGSHGSEYLYKQAALGKVAGLIFEPTFADGSLVSSRKGSANFTLVVSGTAAHAGREFEKGKSAIVALSKFIHEAHHLNQPQAGITINFGSIEGGGADNIVPDFSLCRINVRILNSDQLKNIKTSFNQIIKKISEEMMVEMVLHENGMRAPKPFDRQAEKLFDILQKVGLQQNQQINLRLSGGVSDGNILAGVGLATIDTLGVIGGNLHTFDEYMLLDSLKEKVKLVIFLIIELIEKR